MTRQFDVFRHRQRFRPIPVRQTPTDWDTAIADFRRHQDMGATMSMFEVDRHGQRIRQVTDNEITNNKPEDVEA